MSSLAGLSASVTRILSLTGFPKELKTKDIQGAFSEWENVNGGFKIKWKDDTSLLIVFNDASVAKRAYLQTLAYPPPILTSSATKEPATIRPYDGPDAQTVIQTVNSRSQHNPNPSRHSNRAASISVFPNGGGGGRGRNGTMQTIQTQHVTIPEYTHSVGREPSPTLPSIPSHPTLNSLINSSLGEVGGSNGNSNNNNNNQMNPVLSDPAVLATSMSPEMGGGIGGGIGGGMGGPRIGDPGKRMLGAALGVRHPGLPPRGVNGGDQGMRDVQRAMGGLVVAE